MIRQLGFSEARMHYMHALFEGTTQTLAAVRLRGGLNQALLRAVLDEIVARHELLHCTIREREDVPAFERVEPARSHLEFLEEPDWRAGFEAINSSRLSLERSPWKLCVLVDPKQSEEWELLLVTHHALMDGQAMDRLLCELLGRYHEHSTTSSRGPALEFRPVPLAAESLLPRTLTWSEFTSRQARLVGLQPPRVPDRHVSHAPHAARRTATRFLTLSSEHTQQLSRRAAEHGASFNSWVAACWLRAVFENSPSRATIALNTAFSLRAQCDGLRPDDLGCYIAVVPTIHENCAERPTSEVAREHGRLLARAIFEYARHPATTAFGALRGSLEPLSQLDAFIHDIGYTYAETNLRGAYGDLTVQHFFASANRALGSASVVLHGVKHAEAVYFTVNYTIPLQSVSWVQGVTASLVRLLTPRSD